MLTDEECYREYQDNYRYAHDFWNPFITNARTYSLAAAGYTWTDEERRELEKEGREPLELNVIRRPLQFFSGYLRDNLNSIVIAPVEGADQKTADQLTKASYQIWDKGYGYATFLDAQDEMFKSGISLVGIQMDYSKDFINGDATFFKRTYNSFYLDPTFEHIDLRDCAYGITRDLIGREEAKQLLKNVDPKVIDDIQRNYRDDKFLSYHPQFTTLARNRDLLAYDQYYRKTTRKRLFLIDMDNSYYKDITDLPSEQKKMIKDGIKRLNWMRENAEELGINMSDLPPPLEVREVERPFVELNVMLNGQRVFCGEDQTQITETYPFVPSLCYFEPSIWWSGQRIQGIASTMWGAQRQFNKRHMKIIDMMDSTISKGFKYLIGSVKDPHDLQQSGQNKIIGVDPESAPEGLNSVQELNGGSASPELIQYQQVLDNLTLTLSNVNESVLGADEKGNTEVSGKLAEVRIAQGLRSNRKVFDQIETCQQILGTLVMKVIQRNYPPGKIQRMIGEEPTEQFYEKEFEQYDAVIKQGVRSKSQKDAYYYELVNLKRDGIVDVPQSEIIRSLQMAGMSDLEEAIQQQEQQQQEQQQKIDEQERLAMEIGNADKEEKLALAQERRARVISDIALSTERASESEQNRAKAALDRAKTITEIAKMEDERLMKVIDYVRTLEQEEVIDREYVDEKIMRKADEINTETEGSAEDKQQDAATELESIAQFGENKLSD